MKITPGMIDVLRNSKDTLKLALDEFSEIEFLMAGIVSGEIAGGQITEMLLKFARKISCNRRVYQRTFVQAKELLGDMMRQKMIEEGRPPKE